MRWDEMRWDEMRWDEMREYFLAIGKINLFWNNSILHSYSRKRYLILYIQIL